MKTTRRKRGDKSYEYLSLVEAVRDGDRTGHRTLLRLGEVTALRASGQLDRIVAALEHHLHARPGRGRRRSTAESARAIGATAAVRTVWCRLGLDVHFAKLGAERGAGRVGDAVFAMVANRLVDPCSKRRLREWVDTDVVMPAGFQTPSTDQYYRALDAVAAAKETTEAQLYAALCDLTNLDLRLVCYDLTSTYFEGSPRPSERFPSKAFGYSRDHRSDRPQVVIGLLCTGDGIPIAHHVFAGNTADVTTLPGVLDDLQHRFGVGRICVVADRGLISDDNVEVVAGQGFDHVLATRLHRDPTCAEALTASAGPDAVWVPVPAAHSAACDLTLADGRRAVVVASLERHRRDTVRTAELVARTETKLLALEDRVPAGRLVDAGKIGRAAQRILGPLRRRATVRRRDRRGPLPLPLRRGRLRLRRTARRPLRAVTSLTANQATTAHVVTAYRQLQVRRGPLPGAQRLLAPAPGAALDRTTASAATSPSASTPPSSKHSSPAPSPPPTSATPTSPTNTSPPPAPYANSTASAPSPSTPADHRINLVTRRTPLQARILAALDVDTTGWDRAHIT